MSSFFQIVLYRLPLIPSPTLDFSSSFVCSSAKKIETSKSHPN